MIATGSAPMHSHSSMAEGIARGRYLLIRSTREDFGYDIKSWHDHLAQNRLYAPNSREKPGVYPQVVLTALENPDWIEAVQCAESSKLLERIQSEQKQMLEATYRAERRWGGQERSCPKCDTAFVSVQDRGQCPKCRFAFFASHPDNNLDWWREYAG